MKVTNCMIVCKWCKESKKADLEIGKRECLVQEEYKLRVSILSLLLGLPEHSIPQ